MGRVPSLTSQTVTESSPLVTNSGSVFMKQPEMPKVPGFDSRWRTLPLIWGVPSPSARRRLRTSSRRCRSPSWASEGGATAERGAEGQAGGGQGNE